MYEHYKQPLISSREFIFRMLRHGGWALILIGGSLGLGILGFHYFSHLQWIDALLNSAMLLGGMGPIGEMGPTGGKLFASAFAIYAGLIFIAASGILFTPVYHRLMHKFHLPQK
jgi:hypothetical protein